MHYLLQRRLEILICGEQKMEKLYTVKEASKLFGMSVPFYRKLIQLNQIEYRKVGKAVRLTESAIKAYFDTKTDTVTATS